MSYVGVCPEHAKSFTSLMTKLLTKVKAEHVVEHKEGALWCGKQMEYFAKQQRPLLVLCLHNNTSHSKSKQKRIMAADNASCKNGRGDQLTPYRTWLNLHA